MPSPVWRQVCAEDESIRGPARFVEAMFNCPPTPPNKIPFPAFIAHVVNRTQTTPDILAGALVLLHRLHSLHPHHQGTSGHRLLLAAYMIAHKFLNDAPFSNQSWRTVSRPLGRMELWQINKIESEYLQFLGWEVVITNEDIHVVERLVHNNHTRHYLASPPLSPVALHSSFAGEVSPFTLPDSYNLAVPPLVHSSSSSSSSSSLSSSPRSPLTPASPLSPSTSSLYFPATHPSPAPMERGVPLDHGKLMERFMLAHRDGAFGAKRRRVDVAS